MASSLAIVDSSRTVQPRKPRRILTLLAEDARETACQTQEHTRFCTVETIAKSLFGSNLFRVKQSHSLNEEDQLNGD
jgi:hypothetical protein